MTGDLINTLESPGEFDALTKLRPGEPYIILLGRDRLAPPLVQQWADDNRARALNEFGDGKIDEEKRDRELRKSTQAEAIGWSMVSYKAGHKARDRADAGQATYTGHELPEETKRRDALQSLRVRVATALNNAVGEAADLLALLDGTEQFAQDADLADLANLVRDTVEEMRQCSDLVKPWRPLGQVAA